MNLTQHLLTKLVEEMGEVAKPALKAQTYGLDDCHPETGVTNRIKMCEELDDFCAILEMLAGCGFTYKPDHDRIEAKKLKVQHYLNYAVDKGMVEPKAKEDIKKCLFSEIFR